MQNKYRRIVIVAPMRSHCETVRAIFENGPIDTYLKRTRHSDLDRLKTLERTFGLVAGTGVGKTVFLRDICEHHYGPNFKFTVVTKEHEETDATWQSPVLVCTTGIAMHYLQAGYITTEDAIIIDEIHQTSEHLELSMALAKYKGIPVSWMSATIDPQTYVDYFGTPELLHAEWKDPEKRATVRIVRPAMYSRTPWIEQFMNTLFIDRVRTEKRGVAVFLPSRAMCEKYAAMYEEEQGVTVDFYHGGESAAKLHDYLRGNVSKPFILFMTVAGSSSLNVMGLDTVIIHDETYDRVINETTGVSVLQRLDLNNNLLLQMIGRVDGRVQGGEVYILTERSINVETLRPEVPRFVLAGDREQVALTCARCHIELADLDPIGGMDKKLYNQSRQLLVDRGLISADNHLTEYGQAVCRYPVPRVWAEHLVRAPRELQPFVTVIASCPSLYHMLNRDKAKRDIKEFKVQNDDFLTKYKIVQFIIDHFAVVVRDQNDGSDRFQLRREFYEWAKEKGIFPRVIKDILLSIAAVCREMGVSLRAARDAFHDISENPSNAEILQKALGITLRDAKANVSIGALLKQLYLEVGALTMSVNGYLNDGKTHTECSDASTCLANGSVIMGQATARETKFGVRHDLEGVVMTINDLRSHLDPAERSIQSVTADYEGEYVTVSYSYSGFGFSTLANEELEYEELPDDEAHRAWIPQAIEAFVERLAEFTLFDEGDALPPEIVENNRKIVEAISRYEKAKHEILHCHETWPPYCQEADETTVAKKAYGKMLANTGIYTMAMAQKANFDFRMSDSLIPTEPLPAKPAPRASEWATPISPAPIPPRFGTNVGSLLNSAPMPIRHMNGKAPRPDPTIGATSLAGIKPMKTKAEIRKDQEREAREKMKAELAAQAEPQGRTQARLDWLEAKADEMRAQIAAATSKLAELRSAEEQAAAAYDAAFKANNGEKGNSYTKWLKASEAAKAAGETLASLKEQLNPKIDKIETEALEIMEQLDAK